MAAMAGNRLNPRADKTGVKGRCFIVFFVAQTNENFFVAPESPVEMAQASGFSPIKLPASSKAKRKPLEKPKGVFSRRFSEVRAGAAFGPAIRRFT